MQKPAINSPVYPTCPTAKVQSAAKIRQTNWTAQGQQAFIKSQVADRLPTREARYRANEIR